MLSRVIKPMAVISSRTYKNFGHKRQPEAFVTVIWQGFLTFTFIGLGIEWKRVARMFFGEDHGVEYGPFHANIPGPPEKHPTPAQTSTIPVKESS